MLERGVQETEGAEGLAAAKRARKRERWRVWWSRGPGEPAVDPGSGVSHFAAIPLVGEREGG